MIDQVAFLTPFVLAGTFGVLGLCLVMLVLRMLMGPNVFDRLAALESSALVILSIMVVWSLATGTSWLFDAVLVFSLVGYLSTVALAKYLERGTLGGD